jgi:arylsulfatase A-like enzyme
MAADRPNVIVMLMDNLGYGDLGCYGSRCHRTPHLDRMAAEGVRLTSCYSTSGVCTPSRASLMTGCYPRRVSLHYGGQQSCVLHPIDPNGLHPDEITLARLLRGQGYATTIIGKWHLGDQPEFLPTRHGFDSFFGIPYSEDMVEGKRGKNPPLPLMRDDTVIEAPPDRDYLTQRYTQAACDYIRAHRDQPFFLYLPHAMPGSCDFPFASPAWRGRSANGIYGDAVEELDWSAGEILRTLQETGLDERTLLVWTSDNGAVRFNPPQGSNAPLRGWGYDTSEGGQRIPALIRWPGHLPAGHVTDEIVTLMDIFPTVARLAGAQLPADRTIDGHDLWPLLTAQPDATSAYDRAGFFYYHMHQLQAVRSGPWKLYLPMPNKVTDLRADYTRPNAVPATLYHLRDDIGETHDLAPIRHDIAADLMNLANRARADLGDWDRPGANQRPAGHVAQPTPRLLATR